MTIQLHFGEWLLIILKTISVIPYPYNFLIRYPLSLKLFCQLSLIPKTPNRASVMEAAEHNLVSDTKRNTYLKSTLSHFTQAGATYDGNTEVKFQQTWTYWVVGQKHKKFGEFLVFCGFLWKPKACGVSLGSRTQDYKLNILENGRKGGHFGGACGPLSLLLC